MSSSKEKEIFRKVALERASSPEQLDQLITITTPAGWVALLAILIFLTATVIWGIYGSIPTQVEGRGILLFHEGVISVQVPNTGRITRIAVDVGDSVQKGQIIARIEREDLIEQIKTAQADLKALETSFEEKRKTESETERIQREKLRLDRLNQEQAIKNLRNQLEAQNAFKQQQQTLKEGLEKLVTQGILSKNKLLEAENELVKIDQQINSLKLDIETAKNQLNSIEIELKKMTGSGSLDELTQAQRVEKARNEILALQKAFAETSQVVSPESGRVIEVLQRENDLANAGTTLFLLEKSGENLEMEAVVYFPALTGKQVKRGMRVQITPSIVKREEYGFLEGTVAEVDQYPSTFMSVMKTIQNEALARLLTSDQTPIKVRASLISDPKTTSGYKWSSRLGPPLKLDRGTICFVTVTVREQAPITLVMPLFKKYILGESSSKG
ncbi:membrane-fusion protein [Candidatus Moduliflexus flocculans]|uniref:Membrane-fusion protein n=1 Tax=Candidatus Moduliflexus flocculans TaxID=1499966 RepID=A0A081BN44_9BACT|nr:membrane-fusion protein [Candidatus Moduliflexus flocculans]